MKQQQQRMVRGNHAGSLIPPNNFSYKGGRPPLGLPTDEYQDVGNFILRDTVRFKRGIALPNRPIQLFTHAVGTQRAFANDPATYEVLSFETNRESDQLVPKDNIFEFNSIQIQVLSLGSLPATSGSGNAATFGIDPGGPSGTTNFGAVTSPTQMLNLIVNTIMFNSEFGSNKRYENGPIIEFPTEFGINGSVTSASLNSDLTNDGLGATTTNAIDNSFVQNGFGRPYYLHTPRRLEGLDRFKMWFECPIAFVPNQDFQIVTRLVGWRARQVQ